MPRRKKTLRKVGAHKEEDMQKALALVVEGKSIRKSAKDTNLPYPTVRRYVKKMREEGTYNIRMVPNYEVNRVFTAEQEQALISYYKNCALMFYGLTTKDCRKVAYDMARINNIQTPACWEQEKMAGKEWLRTFRRRHSDITLRTPEPCSLARATSFNKENVKTFFNNLKEVIRRQPSFADGTRIYNLDETATTTVQKPQKVIAPTGIQNLGKVTSGEKGTLVTTCCIVSATGHALPPAIVFPRKNFKQIMLYGAPPGALGLAASTGWMNSEIFVDVMKHFIKHSATTSDNPSLLVMDNHESHLSIEALDLAKRSGVTILTLHPHKSAKMQPLDVGLLAPFKKHYNAAVESWLLRNPGRPISIYQIAECVGIAYPRAMTPINIINAFCKCGIFPFNSEIFSETDFLPSSVTDRPDPADVVEVNNHLIDEQESTHTLNISLTTPPHSEDDLNNSEKINDFSNSNVNILDQNNIDGPSRCTSHFVSPEAFRAPLKTGPRANKRKSRKLGKSMIATDTPEKDAIAEERNAAKRRKAKKDIVKRQVLEMNTKRKRKQQKIESDSEEEEFEASGSSSGGDWCEEDDTEPTLLTDDFEPLLRDPEEGDHVLVTFETSKQAVYYVGKILEKTSDTDDDYFVSFMRVKDKGAAIFSNPFLPDLASVKGKDIKFILPTPQVKGSQNRQQTYHFSVIMSSLNLR